MDLYLWQPRDSTIEVLTQGFVNFQLDLFYLCDKESMEVDNLILQIDTLTGLLTKESKGLIIVSNIFSFIIFEALLDVPFSDIRIIGLHIGP